MPGHVLTHEGRNFAPDGKAPATPEVCTCGHAPKPNGISAGFMALEDADGVPATFCASCADQIEINSTLASGHGVFYLADDGRSVKTWHGTPFATVARSTSFRGGWNRSMLTAVSAVAPDGSRWHGRGSGRGMILRLHRSR